MVLQIGELWQLESLAQRWPLLSAQETVTLKFMSGIGHGAVYQEFVFE